MSALPEAVAESVRLFPTLQRLVDLGDAGWRFIHGPKLDGVPIYIDGFRQWAGGVVDGLRVRADTDALGIRTGRRSPADPPMLLWERAGDLTEIVSALLTLPAPDERLAPRLVLGAGPTLWTPERAC